MRAKEQTVFRDLSVIGFWTTTIRHRRTRSTILYDIKTAPLSTTPKPTSSIQPSPTSTTRHLHTQSEAGQQRYHDRRKQKKKIRQAEAAKRDGYSLGQRQQQQAKSSPQAKSSQQEPPKGKRNRRPRKEPLYNELKKGSRHHKGKDKGKGNYYGKDTGKGTRDISNSKAGQTTLLFLLSHRRV